MNKLSLTSLTKSISNYCLFLFLTTFNISITLAQDVTPPEGTPQTANSMEIAGRTGNNNVNMSTGTLNTSFHLAALSGGNDISTNVSLNYTHGQGIRVNEISGIAGLGFDIQAGGTLTRTVRGVPDENVHISATTPCSSNPYKLQIGSDGQQYLYGWFDQFDFYQYDNSVYSIDLNNQRMGSLVEFLKELTNPYGYSYDLNDEKYLKARQIYYGLAEAGLFDTEPDLFTFNFNGYSGSFVFKGDGTPVILDNQDIKIFPAIGPHSTPGDAWVFITPDGTRYVFENSDDFRDETVVDALTGYPDKIDNCNAQDEGHSSLDYISAWHLSRIEGPGGTIYFNYESENDDLVTTYTSYIKQDTINHEDVSFICHYTPYGGSPVDFIS